MKIELKSTSRNDSKVIKIDEIINDFKKGNSNSLDFIKEPLYSAMGSNCYLKVKYIPEEEKDYKIIGNLSFMANKRHGTNYDINGNKSYYGAEYTMQLRPAVINNEIQQFISDACFKQIIDAIHTDIKDMYGR
jgi:hypothetical protein